MGDVVELNVSTTLEIDPGKVLMGANAAGLDSVIVIGRSKDGQLYLASSDADIGEMLLLIEMAKQEMAKQEIVEQARS